MVGRLEIALNDVAVLFPVSTCRPDPCQSAARLAAHHANRLLPGVLRATGAVLNCHIIRKFAGARGSLRRALNGPLKRGEKRAPHRRHELFQNVPFSDHPPRMLPASLATGSPRR